MADTVYDYQIATKLPEAWTLAEGQTVEPVKIAIIDVGFLTTNELGPSVIEHRNFWTDIQGGDPVNGDDATVYPYSGLTAHGTATASIAGAPHTGTGMKGSAPNAQLMLLRAFSDVGTHGDYYPLYYAIRYAVDNGAKAINISTGERFAATNSPSLVTYGGRHYTCIQVHVSDNTTGRIPEVGGNEYWQDDGVGSSNPAWTNDEIYWKDSRPTSATHRTYMKLYQKAIAYARDNNVYIGTGVGNSADNIDAVGTFWVPAELGDLQVIAGGLCTNYNGTNHPASDYNIHELSGTTQYFDEAWYWTTEEPEETTGRFEMGSNFGSVCNIAVPAEYIGGLFGAAGYVEISGLSAAAPQLTGLAGLLKGVNPALTLDELSTLIKAVANTDAVSPTNPVGTRRINAEKAVTSAIAAIETTTHSIDAGETEITLTGWGDATYYRWDGGAWTEYTAPVPVQYGLFEYYSENIVWSEPVQGFINYVTSWADYSTPISIQEGTLEWQAYDNLGNYESVQSADYVTFTGLTIKRAGTEDILLIYRSSDSGQVYIRRAIDEVVLTPLLDPNGSPVLDPLGEPVYEPN